MIIGLIFLFFAIAAISEAVMDSLAHHFKESWFCTFNERFWNPAVSGVNKWKNGDKKQGERFFLSSTLLVGVTEAWHLFKTIRTFTIFCGFGCIEYFFTNSIMVTISSRVVFGIVFTVFYKALEDETVS
jgi:hypothetical protein